MKFYLIPTSANVFGCGHQVDDALKGEVSAEYVTPTIASKLTVDTEFSDAKTTACVTMGPMLVSLVLLILHRLKAIVRS